MEGTAIATWSCVAGILLVGGMVWVKRGVTEALGVAVVLSFLAPTWLSAPLLGAQMPVRTLVSMAALLAFTFRDPRQIISRLTILDCLIAGMVIIHCLSDIQRGWDAVAAGFLSYGEWAIPYVAGRYAVRSARAMEPLALCVCGVLVVFAVGGMLESLTGINPWEIAFGDRPVEGFPRDASRFGLKRAFGPTRHPIYFGLLILVLCPWAVSSLFWARNGAQRTLAIAATASTAGVCSTLSRGPVLGWGIMAALTGAIWGRWYRWLLGVATVVMLVWIATNFSGFMSMLDRLGGEESVVTKMKLDGKQLEISSVRHRLVLFQVYGPAMKEAGLLGYGSTAMNSLPPDVPYLPANKGHREALKFVDNAFAFTLLRFGWAGLAVFTLLIIAAIYTGVRLSWDRSIGILTGSSASMLVAMAISMLSVWFCYDFGFELLWTYGVLGGLASYSSR